MFQRLTFKCARPELKVLLIREAILNQLLLVFRLWHVALSTVEILIVELIVRQNVR